MGTNDAGRTVLDAVCAVPRSLGQAVLMMCRRRLLGRVVDCFPSYTYAWGQPVRGLAPAKRASSPPASNARGWLGAPAERDLTTVTADLQPWLLPPHFITAHHPCRNTTTPPPPDRYRSRLLDRTRTPDRRAQSLQDRARARHFLSHRIHPAAAARRRIRLDPVRTPTDVSPCATIATLLSPDALLSAMASTPAAPERVHTPPPPLHGTRYDDWEPYSPPRRSSRVAAQRSKHALDQQSHQPEPSKKRPAPRSARAFTPVGSSKRDAPTSSFTASPPASPSSPQTRPIAKKSAPKLPSDDPFLGSDTDSDPFVTSSKGSFGVLPTPSKTPSRKDKARPLSAFASTARVLFHDRPATIDDAMPSSRKSRSNKKRAAFTLPSFIDECEDDESEKIQIYTDFRERVPSVDEEEDNPFITKKPDENDEPNARPSVSPRAAKRRVTKEEAEMDRRARNGEGFISVL